MARVIVNTARYGSGYASGIKTRLRMKNIFGPSVDWSSYDDWLHTPAASYEDEWDDYNIPSRISRRHRHYDRWDTKSQNDRTQPLYRLLEKSVGRPWNKVWSEICSKTSPHSIDGNHLRDHVRQYVDFGSLDQYYSSFFVDGKGFLRQRQRTQYSSVKIGEIEKIEISETLKLELRGGYWFVVRYHKIPKGTKTGIRYDGITKTFVPVCTSTDSFKVVDRRQVNSKAQKCVNAILASPRCDRNEKNALILHAKNQYNIVVKQYASGVHRKELEKFFSL